MERNNILKDKDKRLPKALCLTGVCLVLLLALLSGCASKKVIPLPTTPPSSASNFYRDLDTTRQALSQFYSDWKGTPYKLGGMSRSAVDCSALTYFAYREIFGLRLPRTVKAQADIGKTISRQSLQPGDLVFFKTGLFQRHVGIYLDKSMFMHASSSRGVMISQLDEPYWHNKYWKASRIYQL